MPVRKNLMVAQQKGTPAARARAREAFKNMRAAVPARKRPRQENLDNPVVKCLVCSRITQADMCLDVHDLDVGADFACDGCTSRWQREGRM